MREKVLPGPATPAVTDPEPIDPAVVQQATEWMARLWSGENAAAEVEACIAWRAAHPDHELAWRRLRALADKFDNVPRHAASSKLLDAESAPVSRRRALRMLGLMVVTGGAAYMARETDVWQSVFSDYRTAIGETREIMLADGTRVLLNTASAVAVRFDIHERRVVLLDGEILVTTAAEPRPFFVQTRQGLVRALGTRFTVRLADDRSRVDVFQGAVELRPARAEDAVMTLTAGQGTAFSSWRARPPRPVEEGAAAWARGMLVAERMRLADFLAELGRYRHGFLHCDDSVADLRVTGVFALEDTDRVLANLARALPVEMVYRTRLWVSVRSRSRPAKG